MTEIKDIRERAAGITRCHNSVDGIFAGALNGAQAITNCLGVDRCKAEFGGVDIRPQNRQTVGFGIVMENLHRIGVIHIGRQRRRHERRRMVRLEPGRVISHHGIGRRVRFVETVLGELFHEIEQLHGQLAVDTILRRTVAEDAAMFGHFFGLFLTHRPPQHIGGAQRVAADQLRDLHHLFLIHDHTVGRRQTGLERLMEVVNLLQTLLAQNEVVHHARAQRARSIERQHGDDVFKTVGRQLLEQLLHPFRFDLEDRRRIGIFQDLVGGRIVKSQLAQIRSFAG